MFKFELNKEEATFILQVLGELPTRTNAHTLYTKWDQAMKNQTPETTSVNVEPEREA